MDAQAAGVAAAAEAAAASGASGAAAADGSGDGRPLRLLHLSDLHFGHQFQQARWTQLLHAARQLAPDLVVVTGDLVNTPWRWRRSAVVARLDELAAALSVAPDRRVPLWVIAGNHDTRITGLLPVPWLLPTGAVLGAAAAAAGLLASGVIADAAAVAAGALAAAALLLRALVVPDMARAVGDPYCLREARLTACRRVGLLPLDSASHGLSWARGQVDDQQLAELGGALQRAQAGLAPGAPPPVWIALVHHHPLPLPYDSANEPMMVMDNAGAVLHALTGAGIRLVLHGHKHHQHYARIVIDSARTPYAELSVLSAGTPTERRNAGAYWHGFNLVEVGSDGRVRIGMLQAPPEGGAFALERSFDLVPPEQHERGRHAADARRLGSSCRRLLCVADINAYGDARFVREFRALQTSLRQLDRLAGVHVAEASAGMVEAVVAQSLSAYGPTVSARPQRRSAQRIDTELYFPGGLQAGELPIDFALEFQGNSAFALNRWQFRCMYPGRDDGQEQARFAMPPDLAIEELWVHLRFPPEIRLPVRLNLRVLEPSAGALWRSFPPDSLLRIDAQRVVQARVAYPVPGAVYQVDWAVDDGREADAGIARQRAIERALDLRARLDALQGGALPPGLIDLLGRVELSARDVLGAGREQQPEAFHIALFSFDDAGRRLRYLAGSHADDDARRGGAYAFGLGLVGRAFKAGGVVAFRRPPYPPDEQAWGYVLPDGGPVERAAQVPEVAMLAVALSPRDALDWPYAVLQLSTDNPACLLKTTNTASDASVELFAAALAELSEDVEAILKTP